MENGNRYIIEAEAIMEGDNAIIFFTGNRVMGMAPLLNVSVVRQTERETDTIIGDSQLLESVRQEIVNNFRSAVDTLSSRS